MSTPYLRFTGGALRIRAPAKTTSVDTSILKTNTPVAIVEVPTAAPEPVAVVEVPTAAPEPELNREYAPLEVKPTLEIPEASLESGLIPEDPAA